MAKKKDWFSKLKEQGRITDPEFDKFIAALSDEDIPDNIIAQIENNFMTYDRAIADPKVNGKIRSEVFDTADMKINELIDVHLKSYLDPLQIQELKREGTYKKMDLLNKIIPDTLKKVKTGTVTDEEFKRQLKDKEKIIEELGLEKVSISEKAAQREAQLAEQHGKKLEELELGFHLHDMANKYTLAEAFEKDRKSVTELVLGKVKGQHLKLVEQNGQKEIVVNDEHGKPKFDGNSAVKIQSLLDEHFKPFVKKSETNGNGAPPPGQQRTTVVPPKQNQNPNKREGSRNVAVKK